MADHRIDVIFQAPVQQIGQLGEPARRASEGEDEKWESRSALQWLTLQRSTHVGMPSSVGVSREVNFLAHASMPCSAAMSRLLISSPSLLVSDSPCPLRSKTVFQGNKNGPVVLVHSSWIRSSMFTGPAKDPREYTASLASMGVSTSAIRIIRMGSCKMGGSCRCASIESLMVTKALEEREMDV